MAIHETLKASIPAALRAHDEVKLRTLRSLVTAMTNEVVAKKRKPDEFLTDDEAVAVLKRAANQRKDSLAQFQAAARADLAAHEQAELAVIETLLPPELSREEIEAVVRRHLETGAFPQGAGSGRLLGTVMKELKGKADGALVKEVAEDLLFKAK